MTKFPVTPCMQNSEVSLEQHELRVNHANMLSIAVEASNASQARKDAVRQQASMLRLEHHPDHWFIDPGSGRETEDGRLRRRALEACWADCPMKARLLCLDRGLQKGPALQYGIYGGYTEKQRQAVAAEIEERRG